MIADADHGRENNFNLLRMAAATTVMVSHAGPIALGRGVPEPLEVATGYTMGVGAVIVFFAISGYFITKSFDRRASLADFALARASRIFPGLIVALLFTAFVLGPFFTTLSIGQYLAQRDTWTYAPQNALLVHQQFALPQVFASNPFAGVANGPLWTLKYEVACYLGVVIAGFLGLSRPKFMPLLLTIAAAAMIITPGANMNLSARVAIICGAFAFGAGVYVYRRRVPISVTLAILLAAAAVVSRQTHFFPLFYAISLGYAALIFGFANFPVIRQYNRLGDYSYGMYIYALPISQAVCASVPKIGTWGVVAFGFPIALTLAMISWTCIEGPALRHRHWLAARVRLSRSHRETATVRA